MFLYKLWAKFLTAFGNVRISKHIPWLYYDTTEFKVTGEKILEIAMILKPGDIILRGYDSYLDSRFIDDPLRFSHAAIYAGETQLIHAVAEGVSYINLIDFCQCDRIAVLRPKKNVKKALNIAKSYIGTGYDFIFENGNSELYCFELAALSYPDLVLKQFTVRKLLFIKKTVYLAKSFFDSPDFECVFQYNPKFDIDFIK